MIKARAFSFKRKSERRIFNNALLFLTLLFVFCFVSCFFFWADIKFLYGVLLTHTTTNPWLVSSSHLTLHITSFCVFFCRMEHRRRPPRQPLLKATMTTTTTMRPTTKNHSWDSRLESPSLARTLSFSFTYVFSPPLYEFNVQSIIIISRTVTFYLSFSRSLSFLFTSLALALSLSNIVKQLDNFFFFKHYYYFIIICIKNLEKIYYHFTTTTTHYDAKCIRISK